MECSRLVDLRSWVSNQLVSSWCIYSQIALAFATRSCCSWIGNSACSSLDWSCPSIALGWSFDHFDYIWILDLACCYSCLGCSKVFVGKSYHPCSSLLVYTFVNHLAFDIGCFYCLFGTMAFTTEVAYWSSLVLDWTRSFAYSYWTDTDCSSLQVASRFAWRYCTVFASYTFVGFALACFAFVNAFDLASFACLGCLALASMFAWALEAFG